MSWRDFLSGGVGGVTCTYCGLPFDVAKARLQNQARAGQYRGLFDCISQTVRHEGPLALFRGALPAMSSAVSENMVGVTVQRGLRRQLAGPEGQPAGASPELQPMMELGVGALTGVFTSVTICPFEVLKVNQQVQSSHTGGGASLLSVLKQVARGHYASSARALCLCVSVRWRIALSTAAEPCPAAAAETGLPA